jgi:hypothetical protein
VFAFTSCHAACLLPHRVILRRDFRRRTLRLGLVFGLRLGLTGHRQSLRRLRDDRVWGHSDFALIPNLAIGKAAYLRIGGFVVNCAFASHDAEIEEEPIQAPH